MNRITVSLGTAALVASVLMGAAFVYADDDNKGKGNADNRGQNVSEQVKASITTLQEQIKKLREQMEELRKKSQEIMDDARGDGEAVREARSELKEETKGIMDAFKDAQKAELKFARSLIRGMSGDDVSDLQELLAQDPDVYPAGLVTGFFGSLTEEAVRKFQEKYGIERVGIFGPKTQARILALFTGRELPPGIIRRLGLLNSSTTPGSGIVTICHKPAGVAPQTLVIPVPALGAHLAHGDTAGVCPGGTSTTTPPADTVAPSISSVAASNIASTSATVSWSTNEIATSKLYFSTTSPVDFLTAMFQASVSATTSHSFTLSGLTASTTYFYVPTSKDAAGNNATSSTLQFTTAI